MSNTMLALVAVAGLALAGYASAASEGLLPESVDMGLGAQKRCERANANAEGAPAMAACANGLRHRGPAARCQAVLQGEVDLPEGVDREAIAERCAKLQERQGERDGPRDGMRKPHHRPPPFHVENGTVSGKWVGFQVAADEGALLDYTSKGPFADAVVFERIQLEPSGEGQASWSRGPLWIAKDGKVGAVAFNAPNALFAVKNFGEDTATVTYTLADGIAAEESDRGIALSHDGHTAYLVTRGDATAVLEGNTVVVTLGQGGVSAFAIEGYPKLLHAELRVLNHLGERLRDRAAAGEPGPEPLPPEAEVDEAMVEADEAANDESTTA